MSRRQFLVAAGVAGLGLSTYSYQRSVRFPTLSYEPKELANAFKLDGYSMHTKDLLVSDAGDNSQLRIRAYAPEPELVIEAQRDIKLQLIVNNVALEAELLGTNNFDIEETVQGITRQLVVSLSAGDSINLKWTLTKLKDYSFAVIGDTGGDKELAWCIQRAADLGARFLLHLGDFNYQEGDYPRSINLFNASPIPCYVSIGNHDFHDSGLLYNQFRQEIGPLNNAFAIGKTRFVNIDTAANTLPYGGGHRGQLLQSLIASTDQYTSTVAFTHRPIHDPSDEGGHDLGSSGERDWLIQALKKIGVSTLLSGHVHIYNRGTYYGLENIIVGQGLGHQDLIVNADYSKMLIGQVDAVGKVVYHTEPLAMPMALHCHPRTDVVKQSLTEAAHYPVIKQIDEQCKT
jgi:hypothetical protein